MKKNLFLFLSVFLYLWFPSPVFGAYSTCVVSVSPSSVYAGSTTNITFNIENHHYSDSAPILWVKMIVPSDNFYIEGAGGDGSEIVKTVSIPVETSSDQVLSVTTGLNTAASANWTVLESTDADGANPTVCTGTLGTAIEASPSTLSISDVVATINSTTSVVITWNTTLAASSYVFYGKSDYSSIAFDTTPTTFHSITISGLSPGSTYMYYVQSSNESDTVSSTHSTFNTLAEPTSTPTPIASVITRTITTTTTTTITNTVVREITVTPTPTPLPDKILPVVTVNSDFSNPFTVSPLISGKAQDNIGISKIEYSVDNGKNWLSVEGVEGLGKKVINYSFTPAIYEDGNYKLRVRAKDMFGNIGYSKKYVLVIDRLPPQIGAVMFSIGAQVLLPNEEGIIFSLPNMNQKITLSAVGGPTSIDILSNKKNYSLSENEDNGLWSGILNFDKTGVYVLMAKAIDGANNITDRKMGTVAVLDWGKIASNDSDVTSGAVTLWYSDDQSQKFVVWDGKPYGQTNPQKITKNGEYGFFAPPGRYYLEVKSFGFKTLKTQIFTLTKSLPVTPQLKLEKSFTIKIGPFSIPLPSFSISKQTVSIKSPVIYKQAQPEIPILGNSFPNVNIYLNGDIVSALSFRGKPTVFTFISTWSPYVFEQLEAIREISADSSINVVPIVSQETSAVTDVFSKRGEYPFSIYSDPDGLLVKSFNLSFLPTSVFTDKERVVKKIKIGILTKEELLKDLSN